MSIQGYVHSIETGSAIDGPGIRSVIFLQGCPFRCLFCHNPDTWTRSESAQRPLSEIVKEALKYQDFYRLSGGGVTVSGGEPLMQPEFVAALFRELHAHTVHTALDTCGYVALTPAVKEVVKHTDLVLLDIKHLNPETHKELTGKPNDRVFAFLNYLRDCKKDVWIRIVLVSGYSTDPAYAQQVSDFLKNYPNVKKVELLPYHELGKSKWENLGYEYKLSVSPPDKATVQAVTQVFADNGFTVLVSKS